MNQSIPTRASNASTDDPSEQCSVTPESPLEWLERQRRNIPGAILVALKFHHNNQIDITPPTAPAELTASVAEALAHAATENRSVTCRLAAERRIIAVPLGAVTERFASVAIVVEAFTTPPLAIVKQLQAAAGELAGDDKAPATAVDLLAPLFNDAPLKTRLRGVCTAAASAAPAVRVAIGVHTGGRACRVAAVSDVGEELNARAPLVARLAEVMRTIVTTKRVEPHQLRKWPDPNGDHDYYGAEIACTARRRVVILFQCRRQPHSTAAAVNIANVVARLSPYLRYVGRHELGRSVQWRYRANRLYTRLRRPFMIVILALVAAFLLSPNIYHIKAQATIEGAVERTVVAPMDAFLDEVHVIAGERVQKDQLLATFATDDLELERIKWRATRARNKKALRDAAARQERSRLRVLDAEVQHAQAELDLVETTLGKRELRAPLGGMITSGDLEQHLGAPVQRGDMLFTIVPGDHYRLKIKVPETAVRRMAVAASGKVVLNAFPHESLAFVIERVTAVNESDEQGNHFIAYGRLLDVDLLLRPGMYGIAKIDADRAPRIDLWTRDFRAWVSLRWWQWFGA